MRSKNEEERIIGLVLNKKGLNFIFLLLFIAGKFSQIETFNVNCSKIIFVFSEFFANLGKKKE